MSLGFIAVLISFINLSAPSQHFSGFLGSPGARRPASGPHSPPPLFANGDSLQTAAATAAILNLSTRYRNNMEAAAAATGTAGRPRGPSTKVAPPYLPDVWSVSRGGRATEVVQVLRSFNELKGAVPHCGHTLLSLALPCHNSVTHPVYWKCS